MVEFSESQNISLSAILVAAYLVAFLFSKSKELVYVFGANIASQCYVVSPLYNLTLEVEPSLVFIVYASIYFTVIRCLATYKIILSCFIMGLFEVLMYKAYLNEIGHGGLEESLYDNYEYIVSFLHLLILCSMVRWDIVQSYCRSFCDSILRPFLHQRLLLPYCC